MSSERTAEQFSPKHSTQVIPAVSAPPKSNPSQISDLPDEVVLNVFSYLHPIYLVKCTLVCKRWNQITKDPSLWPRLDLGLKNIKFPHIFSVLNLGVKYLRLAQSKIVSAAKNGAAIIDYSAYLSTWRPLRIQYLDLSMSSIPVSCLNELLQHCCTIKKLSLESLEVNEQTFSCLKKAQDLDTLNLCLCQGVSPSGVIHLKALTKLESLNIAWALRDRMGIIALIDSLSHSLKRLNLSGCRDSLLDPDVRNLVKASPDLIELDLSDCSTLQYSCDSLIQLKHLRHLAISRCDNLVFIEKLTCLNLECLDMFTHDLLTEDFLFTSFPKAAINQCRTSTIARPTVGQKKSSIWGMRTRPLVKV